MKKQLTKLLLLVFMILMAFTALPHYVSQAHAAERMTYFTVFSSMKGNDCTVKEAEKAKLTCFERYENAYFWCYLHDKNGNFYKSYSDGINTLKISVYKPDGTLAYSSSKKNVDKYCVNVQLTQKGTWKIVYKVSGARAKTTTKYINVINTELDTFASTVGDYSVPDALNAKKTKFKVGDKVYVWGYLHDKDGNLYKSYGNQKNDLKISIYRPDGSCKYSGSFTNKDSGWISTKLDKVGTWKIECTTTGYLKGTDTQRITVVENRRSIISTFASPKGKGYTWKEAREARTPNYKEGDYVYVWGYLHDDDMNLYKTYGGGTCNLTLSIYRPNGTCKYTYTYSNSDNNWIGTKLDEPGKWKIEAKVTGSMKITATLTLTVAANRTTYIGSFASTKGKNCTFAESERFKTTTFNEGDRVYAWGYLRDENGNLYKTYGTGINKLTISLYRPDGTCKYTYTFNDKDNTWISVTVDMPGTWKIVTKSSGAINGTNTKTFKVNVNRTTYTDLFASTKGYGYSLTQAKSAATSYFAYNDEVYVWGYIRDSNDLLFNEFSNGVINLTISIYYPSGRCAYTYTYNDCDNDWISMILDQRGTWTIEAKVSGILTGSNKKYIYVE